MNDSTISGSDSWNLSSLFALDINRSLDTIDQWNNIKIYLPLLKLDNYVSEIFYPLTIILIGIGTVLNLFSLYCFLKINKRNSQNVYLSVLSLSDTINLHINFGLPLLRKFEIIDNHFRNLKGLCRLIGVLTEFFLIFPTWIIVLLTIERLISLSWRTKRRTPYTQRRTKISIVILAIIVLGLSLYRLKDLKGIDQLSVFSIVACNGEEPPFEFMRNLNLIIWTILPECLTFLMNLIIIYQIKSIANIMKGNPSKTRQLKYNQATRTVLLVSILFLIFHTPTGIMIALDLFYGSKKERTLGIIIILISRKLTMILYEISLSCKFFIYNQTFRNFKGILRTSIFQFTRRANSAKLGRSVFDNAHICTKNQIIHFNSYKQSLTSPVSQIDSYVKNSEEYHNMLSNRHHPTSSTNLSRKNRV